MISDIAFEQISGDFWHANYLGFKVVMMKSSGYINVSNLCLNGGKHIDKWTRLQGSKELMKFFDGKILEEKLSLSTFLHYFTTPANQAEQLCRIENAASGVVDCDGEKQLCRIEKLTSELVDCDGEKQLCK